METSILNNIIASVLTSSAVGVLFFMWINTKFQTLKDDINSLREDLKSYEESSKGMVRKESFVEIRKEDKEGIRDMETRIEKKVDALSRKVEDMPKQIAEFLKPFIK